MTSLYRLQPSGRLDTWHLYGYGLTGSSPPAEQNTYVPKNKRTHLIEAVPATIDYQFSVMPYRDVDQDIDISGRIIGGAAQPHSGVFKPQTTLFFDGTVAALQNSFTVDSSGAGVSPGTTFNGSRPLTLSYNSFGAASLAALNGKLSVTYPSAGVAQTDPSITQILINNSNGSVYIDASGGGGGNIGINNATNTGGGFFGNFSANGRSLIGRWGVVPGHEFDATPYVGTNAILTTATGQPLSAQLTSLSTTTLTSGSVLTVTGDVKTTGGLRATGTLTGATGLGLDLYSDGANGIVRAYNSTSSTYAPLIFLASAMNFTPSAGATIFSVGTTGATVTALTHTGAYSAADGGGQIYMNASVGNRIDFNNQGVNAPTFTTRSSGTKIVLYPSVTASSVDYGLGIDGSTFWQSIPTASAGTTFKWYAGTTNVASLTGTGNLGLTGTIIASNFSSGASVTGTNTGDQTITLTGDVTGTGGGSFPTTLSSTVIELARANHNLSGGGTVTFTSGAVFGWTTRFIVIANGAGTDFSTAGYFDIIQPTSGTITGVGGAGNRAATAAGIPLNVWEALYYILPVGSVNTSIAANFRVATYTAGLQVPKEWVLLAVYNGDGMFLKCPAIPFNLHGNESYSATTNQLWGMSVLPDADNTRSIGSGSARYANMYAVTFNGTATAAQYADLAERYHADAAYEPGTVMVIGGTNEVTACTEDESRKVAGVISTDPALMMNSEAGNDATHPYIALRGRVPCKVVGPIMKGDILVTSSFTGHARAATTDVPANCTVGKALQDFPEGVGVIEVMV